ncbi:MAG: DUF4233 domain-containing protein [Nocardioidaceae bacterium]
MTRSTRRSLCAGMLVLQAVMLFLFGVVSIGMTTLGVGTSLAMGTGLALLCLLAAGLLRGPAGYVLGWLVQVIAVGLGVVVASMFFLGAVFAALWTGAYVLGTKIDREKAERALLEEQWRAEHGAEG